MFEVHNDIGRINYTALLTYWGTMTAFVITVYLNVI